MLRPRIRRHRLRWLRPAFRSIRHRQLSAATNRKALDHIISSSSTWYRDSRVFGAGLAVHAVRRFRHDRAKDEYPCTAISLRINATEIPIPHESYAWSVVFDPKTPSLSLSRNNSLLFLTYSGGDGAESHEIIYCLSDARLREIRTRRLGLLPNGLIGQVEQIQ